MTYRTTIVVAVVMLVAVSLSAQAANQHWLGEPDTPKDFFPIMTWTGFLGDPPGGREGGLDSVAECNFTVAGFVDAADLPECEKLGLKAVVHLSGDTAPLMGSLGSVSENALSDSIKQRIESIGNSKAIIGYYVADEPNADKFARLGREVTAIEKWAPGRLAFINLLPGVAHSGAGKGYHGAADYTDYLERFVAEAKPQMLSYDDYDVIYSDSGQDSKQFWQYVRNLAEVRRVSLEHGIPFWNIVCAMRIRPYTTAPSPADLMVQAYTTLAAGARGITWWRYHVKAPLTYGPIDIDGNRTDTWDYLRMVNRQIKVLGPIMNHLKTTGIFFTDPPAFDDLPPLPGRIVEAVQSISSIKGRSDAKPPVMVGEFAGDDGCDYAMIVNLSMEKSANIHVQTRKTYAAKECISSRNGSAYPFDETNGHWLVPGQGVLIKLTESAKATP